MARFHDAREALAQAPRLAKRGGAEGLRTPSGFRRGKGTAGIGQARRTHAIASIEPDFPLRACRSRSATADDFSSGNVALLQRDMAAIVGARNASALGIKFASPARRRSRTGRSRHRVGFGARDRFSGAWRSTCQRNGRGRRGRALTWSIRSGERGTPGQHRCQRRDRRRDAVAHVAAAEAFSTSQTD